VLAGAVSALSGGVLVCIRLIGGTADEFSTLRHPAEGWLLAIHRWAAPVTILAVGWTIGDHAAVHLRRRDPARATGIPVLVLLLGTIVTGTALQTLDLDAFREAVVWTHVAINAGAVLALLAHWRSVRRRGIR
jgi:hypothetical protein